MKINDGEDGSHVMKMSATGKYPFVTLSQNKVDFEELLVGKIASKELILRNASEVPTNFIIERVQSEENKDPAFSLDSYEGIIPPKAAFSIEVKYVPTLVGTFSCSQYKISVRGGNTLDLTCQGIAKGFDVSLSSKTIHFGEVSQGNTTNRLLNIVNNSELPTSF